MRCLRVVVGALALFAVSACDDGSVPADGGPILPDSGDVGDAGPPDSAVGPMCGDGAIEGDEACDDGNVDDGDGCSAECALEDGFACEGEPTVCETVCRDSIIAGDEECDDGNVSDDDGCSSACQIEPGYQCSGAPSDCVTVCGDGVVTFDERCDDGNAADGDGCTAGCEVEPGVTCEGSPSVCTGICGDGVVASIEPCDDGGTDPGDGCSATCEVERGFACAGAPSVCMAGCGDAIVASVEGCDDGNMDGGDGCASSCQPERGYACSGEPSACATVCGDGVLAGVEACDDGNTTSGDGCSDACAVEAGFRCDGEPSACTVFCGDGVIRGAEGCDDGNLSGGDGCDAGCGVEFGYACAGEPSVCAVDVTVAAVALGDSGGCVVTTTQRVGCFGVNSDGEIGNGTDGVETFLPADTGIADATLVVAGADHRCALRGAGEVWCWGDNDNLQQAVTGTANDQPSPQRVGTFTGLLDVDTGGDHTCVVTSAGEVHCWGDNDNRQLGRGGTSTTDSATPAAVTLPAGRTATAVALGQDHSCALLDDLTVACWGDNDNGQLGRGGASTTDSADPALVAGLADVAQLASGYDNTCARDSLGQVFCWGDNLDGAVGDGTTTDRAEPTLTALPMAATDLTLGNDFACALLTDGSVHCWGESVDYETGQGDILDVLTPAPVRGLGGLTITDVEAGGRGVCVLTDAAQRYCWGYGEAGQLGHASESRNELGAPLAFAGGAPTRLTLSRPEYRGQACASFSDGSVECMGTANSVRTDTTAGAGGIFTGFSEHLTRPTVIPALGGTLQGELGDGFGCGRTATFVACVGDNSQRQLGQGGTATTDSLVPVPVTGLGAVDEIGVGGQFACARTGGDVVCWGDNDNGQTGVAGTTDQGTPVALPSVSDATMIALGGDHGCLVRSTGTVSCWGDNDNGQLGDGGSADSATPVDVIGLPAGSVTALGLGENHSCALVGTEIWCWGDNGYGQLAQGDQTDSSTAVLAFSGATAMASGYNYVCAVETGGGVACWGYGRDGQLGNGGVQATGEERFLLPVSWIGASGITAVVAGNSMTCLESAAGWRCAGFRAHGQLGDGTTLWPTLPYRAAL